MSEEELLARMRRRIARGHNWWLAIESVLKGRVPIPKNPEARRALLQRYFYLLTPK